LTQAISNNSETAATRPGTKTAVVTVSDGVHAGVQLDHVPSGRGLDCRRELFVSFGSCSAQEPLDGLQALGMLSA